MFRRKVLTIAAASLASISMLGVSLAARAADQNSAQAWLPPAGLTVGQAVYYPPAQPTAPVQTEPYALTGNESANQPAPYWNDQSPRQLFVGNARIVIPSAR